MNEQRNVLSPPRTDIPRRIRLLTTAAAVCLLALQVSAACLVTMWSAVAPCPSADLAGGPEGDVAPAWVAETAGNVSTNGSPPRWMGSAAEDRLER
jgi:hypothetical protein